MTGSTYLLHILRKSIRVAMCMVDCEDTKSMKWYLCSCVQNFKLAPKSNCTTMPFRKLS